MGLELHPRDCQLCGLWKIPFCLEELFTPRLQYSVTRGSTLYLKSGSFVISSLQMSVTRRHSELHRGCLSQSVFLFLGIFFMFVLHPYSVFCSVKVFCVALAQSSFFTLAFCFCPFLFFCLFSFGRDNMFWNLGSFGKDPHAAWLMPCCQTSLGKDWLRTPGQCPFEFQLCVGIRLWNSSL